MIIKLFTFTKPYCFRYSLFRDYIQLPIRVHTQRNDFYIKYITTSCSIMAVKTALFIVAEGSEELELVAPVDILRRANVMLFHVHNLKCNPETFYENKKGIIDK